MPARITKDNTVRAVGALRTPIREAEEKASQAGERVATALCPVGVEMGQVHLYQTIRVERGATSSSLVAGDPKRGVHHAGYVVFGTERTPQQDFMSPAVEEMRRVFVDEVKKGVRRRLGG